MISLSRPLCYSGKYLNVKTCIHSYTVQLLYMCFIAFYIRQFLIHVVVCIFEYNHELPNCK